MFPYCLRALVLFSILLIGTSAWSADSAPVAKPAGADLKTSATAASPAPAAAGGDVYAPFYGKKVMHGPVSVKKIALTFDDGPSAKLTPEVIAILKREKVSATFFMLGQSVERYPDVAKMVADAGFEIGDHTMNHARLLHMNADGIRMEIDGAADLIEKVTGKRPHLFRPPYGDVTATMRTVCAESKMVIVHWSVDPRDWAPKSTPDSVFNATMKQMKPGAIVCIHDIHAKTIAALPRIIAELKAKGYTLTTVGDLLGEAETHKMAVPAGGDEGAAASAGPEMMQPAAISLDKSAFK
jgi:peptidoglycan/xylan/chitin deacetylase (PgdA/CDA1 family)